MAIVSYKYGELPPLTEEDMEELRAYAEMSDDEIDTSDIPSLTEEKAARMVQGDLATILRRKRKRAVTVS
jgi:uncharacterized protein (DUF4415 family)